MLVGSENCVNSVSVASDGRLLTGSWDGVVRVWDSGVCVAQLKGHHEHAVEVLGLSNNVIVTGSANKTIVIYHGTTAAHVITNAHGHAIRKLIPHPMGFASTGNDGMIKVWTLDGTLVLNIAAHKGEVKFTYGLELLKSGEFVSSGEDGTVRIFSSSGQPLQTITHPGSVRGLCVLPNGDIVTAAADKTARIFTRDPERTAPDEEISSFNQLSNMALASGMQAMDTSSLPDPSVLRQPGKKEGEIKVVNIPSRGAIVYQWAMSSRSWEEVGEAVGRSQKQSLNGRQYDFVTNVEVTAEVSRKLGFNKDDDPEKVAADFCNINGLPPDYRDQILAHIRPMMDSQARAVRLEKEDQAKLDRLRHIPAWSSGSFEIYCAGKVSSMASKLTSLNEAKLKANDPLAITDSSALQALLANISDVNCYHTNPFTSGEAKVMAMLLVWDGKAALPALDAVRLLMCHTAANNHLAPSANDLIGSRLLSQLQGEASKHHYTLVCKTLCNWIAKRSKTQGERKHRTVPNEEIAFLCQALAAASPAASHTSASVSHGYIMLCHNILIWLGRLQATTSPLYALMIEYLVQALKIHTSKPKIAFYSLLVLGSIAYLSPAAAQIMKTETRFSTALTEAITTASSSSSAALVELSQDMRRLGL